MPPIAMDVRYVTLYGYETTLDKVSFLMFYETTAYERDLIGMRERPDDYSFTSLECADDEYLLPYLEQVKGHFGIHITREECPGFDGSVTDWVNLVDRKKAETT